VGVVAMTRSARARLEDAVADALGDLVGADGILTVRPYAGELAAGGQARPEAVMQALNGLAPGILVTTERGVFKGMSTNRRVYHRDIEVVLYLVSKNQRSREARTRGENEIYEIAELALSRLTGFVPDLGPDVAVGHFEPTSEEVIVFDPTFAIWRQSYLVTVEIERVRPPAPEVTEVLGRVNAPADDDGAADPLIGVSNLIS
jgi:hypothetical protein